MPKYKVSGTPIITFSLPGGGSLPDPRQLCRYRPCINKKLFSTKCGYLEEWKGHHRSVEAEEKQCTNFNMLNSLAGVINNINVMQPGNLEKVVHPCLSMCTPACLCAPLPVYTKKTMLTGSSFVWNINVANGGNVCRQQNDTTLCYMI